MVALSLVLTAMLPTSSISCEVLANRRSPLFDVEALALRAGSSVQDGGAARTVIVHSYESLIPLPSHNHPGTTALHDALEYVQQLLQSGHTRVALSLSELIARGLRDALRTRSVVALNQFWNPRFPSPHRVDAVESDLEVFEGALERLIQMPEYTAAQTPVDTYFMRVIWSERSKSLDSIAHRDGFETHMDLQEALARELGLECELIVSIPRRLQPLLRIDSPLSMPVWGLRTTRWAVAAINERYPALMKVAWNLQSRKKILGPEDMLDPALRLRIVLQRSA